MKLNVAVLAMRGDGKTWYQLAASAGCTVEGWRCHRALFRLGGHHQCPQSGTLPVGGQRWLHCGGVEVPPGLCFVSGDIISARRVAHLRTIYTFPAG